MVGSVGVELLATLESIERRVLWLATRIVDYANRERPRSDALKVGGHQASSASLVSIMTALWAMDLNATDRVSVKPHASPVLHALEYLIGRLEQPYLLRLREFGGLQSYPSQTKDPFSVDFSTGSVGLGSSAPLFAALVDRYVERHFGTSTGGRFISLLGDAELDEGSVWEAIAEPQTHDLGNVLWIVDFNRQSLDRVVPGVRAAELQGRFRASGWNVVELKYGRRLRAAFAEPGGDLLKARLDEMPNEEFQSLFGASDEQVREVVLRPFAGRERRAVDEVVACDPGLVRELGGHDMADVLEALAAARREIRRPTVLFAYTIKGYGLEIAGRPHNHSVLLDADQIDRLREAVGLTRETEWDAFAPGTPESALLADAARRLDRMRGRSAAVITVPADLPGSAATTTVSTQTAFGRALLALSRVPGVGERLVTASPDVAISTNLGGFVNKVGVWSAEHVQLFDDLADSPLKWRAEPSGQHVELGIAEMNLALLLGQLGLTWRSHGERLLPIGTLYDPFLMRALEGFVYSIYAGAGFIVVGTPSGVTLSREGGAHQSINTPGIGIETPGLTYVEPCYARELEWLLLYALAWIQKPDGGAVYFRLSTRPVPQDPLASAIAERGEGAVRADVLRGGTRLRAAPGSGDRVVLAACGAVVPEAMAAADLLAEQEGVEAAVLLLSSPSLLYRDWQRSRVDVLDGFPPRTSHLEELVGVDARGLPVVTVIDGASHALAWIGTALGVRGVPLGVERFGQSGGLDDLYSEHKLTPDDIATAALAALE